MYDLDRHALWARPISAFETIKNSYEYKNRIEFIFIFCICSYCRATYDFTSAFPVNHFKFLGKINGPQITFVCIVHFL